MNRSILLTTSGKLWDRITLYFVDLQDYIPPLPGIKGKSIRHIKTESWRGYGMLVGIRKIGEGGEREREREGEELV